MRDGSVIGGIPETQERLNFCVEHGFVADIELIPIQCVETAFERIKRSEVHDRFVIGNATLA